MVRRLPPLNAIRVFEAAARHLSFTRAAEELNVTQAAVSHQIKALEDVLGVALFRRSSRALTLTEAGQAYFPPLRAALDQIAEATLRLRNAEAAGTLTVSTLPSFAAKWLLPRLLRFQQQHPDIDVRLTSSPQLVNFETQDVDLAIRFGRGEWAGLLAERLMGEEIFPVASPAVRDGPPRLERPEDLRHVALLQDDFIIGWPIWLKAAGVDGESMRRGPFFTDSALVLQAAMAGYGVALGRRSLVGDDIASGRLVRLFEVSVPSDWAYWVVAPERSFQRPKVRAFADWLHAEAAADLDHDGALVGV